MSAATIIANAFGEEANLYTTVLCVSQEATPSQLRKAYYKRALVYHPDKQDASKSTEEELEDAKGKFHAISVAYDILSDPERRKEYDETGELYEDDDDVGSNKTGTDQWKEYFTGMFGKVTTEDIDEFGSKYKGSEEERKDVLRYFKMFKGNLDKMLECVMLSEEGDKQRWVSDYIKPAIKKGEVEEYESTMRKTLGADANDDDNDEEEECEDEDDEGTTESEEDEEENKTKKKSKKKAAAAGKQKKGASKKAPTKKNTKSKSTVNAKASAAAARKKKKQEKEAAEAEDLIAKIRGNAVARRQRGFADMMSGLEERYGGGGGGGGEAKGKSKKRQRKDNVDDIPDDEFEKIRAGLESKRKNKKAKSRK